MSGFFDSLFDADEPTGFFGGDQSSTASASDPTSAPPSASGAPPDVLTYPDGTPVIDPNSKSREPYPRPPGLDVTGNVAFGSSSLAPLAGMRIEGWPVDLRDHGMFSWLAAGQPMDYQRPNGYLAATRGDVHLENRNVTNYNMGAVAAGAGYSLDQALQGAGLYNRIGLGAFFDWARGKSRTYETAYGLKNDAVKNITQGWQDATDGKWDPR
jgi:hypothetical protein